MDSKSILKYASDKLSPDDLNKLLGGGVVLQAEVKGQWATFREGQLYSTEGAVVAGGVGDVTNVRIADATRGSSVGIDPPVNVAPRRDTQPGTIVTEQLGHPETRREVVTSNKEGTAGQATSLPTSLPNAPGRL